MKGVLLSDNAAVMVEDIRNNWTKVKADICDAFADEVYNSVTYSNTAHCWRVLSRLQEYAHLIDCLVKTDKQINE